jgi:hypothetical protein
MLIGGGVEGLKGPLLIVVYGRGWGPKMAADGYCEAAQGHWGGREVWKEEAK